MILLSHLGAPAIPGCPCECCAQWRVAQAAANASAQAAGEVCAWVYCITAKSGRPCQSYYSHAWEWMHGRMA